MNARAIDSTAATGGDASSRLGRECFHAVSLYDPDSTPYEIDLSDNTNLWGVPPAAQAAIAAIGIETIARYPAPYASSLKQSIADYLHVDPSMIVTGCGSDDVLDSAIRAFGSPGDRVAIPDPSFSMIPVFARINGLEPFLIPLGRDGGLSASAFNESGSRITYLCSPNNPTGTSLRRADIDEITSNARGIVIIDQAYAEFSGISLTDLVDEHEHVLITRTMSKAFGLAGLRIGYGIGSPDLVREVEKSRGPYKVSVVGERAAVAALGEDLAWVGSHVAQMKLNRARFIGALERLGLMPLPTDANFVLVPVANAKQVSELMKNDGVAVRSFENLYDIGGAVRITIGPWDMMDRCVSALASSLQ